MKAARVVPEGPDSDHVVWAKGRNLDDSVSVTSTGEGSKALVAVGHLKHRMSTRKGGLGGSAASLKSVGLPVVPVHSKTKAAKRKLIAVLEHKYVQLVMAVVTLYALFGDDFRAATAPITADLTFTNTSFFVLCLYTVEVLLNCWAKPNYVGGFYFWLDFVSTASLIMDVSWCVRPPRH